MPREWCDWHSVLDIEDEKKRALYKSIVVEKKPYFMRYIYPSLIKQYNKYIKKANRNSIREFQMTIFDLMSLEESSLTDKQKIFLHYCEYISPVGIGDCVMNKICKRFEDEFDGYIVRYNEHCDFDYTIMKSDAQYTKDQYYEIRKLYLEFSNCVHNYKVYADYERIDEESSSAALAEMSNGFRRECETICSNDKALCNIILDLCYKNDSTKGFVWSIFSHEIIDNLFNKNNNIIHFPTICPDGDVEYCGKRFCIKAIKTEGDGEV